MTFKQLVDRCKLFVDGTGSLLEELLREAEMELSKECNIYEDNWEYFTPIGTSSIPFVALPSNFKEMIGVWYNGNLLDMCEESQIYRNTDNDVLDGSPSKYYIRNDRLYFDKNLSQSGKILIRYYAIPTFLSGQLPGEAQSMLGDFKHNTKTFNLIRVEDVGGSPCKVWIDTVADADIVGFTVSGYKTAPSSKAVWTIQSFDGKTSSGAEYTINNGGGNVPLASTPLEVHNWHSIAPMIPDEYHKSLCDYAIYIASNRTDPNLSDRHFTLWNNTLSKCKSYSMDRELINNVKWEI